MIFVMSKWLHLLINMMPSAWTCVTADIAVPTAGPRTVTSSSTSSVMPRRQHHRSEIIVHIYAMSEQATKDVVSDIEKVINEYLMDKVLDQPQDQQHIAKLTEDEVILFIIITLVET